MPAAIRKRFSKPLVGCSTAVYVGEITAVTIGRAGWWLAQAARLIDAPLPLWAETGVPSAVTVTEDGATGGQIWTRLYARRNGFPQIVHSSKRFAGPTGLEEYLGRGVGLSLTVHVEDAALVFRSAGFFLQVLGRRVPLPRWLSPGDLTVTHAEVGGGAFVFTLEITHRWFGTLVRQTALFQEFQP